MGKKYRILYTVLMITWDVISVWFAVVLGFRLRFGFVGDLPALYGDNLLFYSLVICIVSLISNLAFNSYSSVWSHASTTEVIKQICAVILSFVIILVLTSSGIVPWYSPISIEVVVFICILLLILQLLGRMSVRALLFFRSKYAFMKKKSEMVRVLIFGAGQAGANLVKKLHESPQDNLMPVALMDDDPGLVGLKINGLPVLGGFDELESVIKLEQIDEVIVAIPSADRELLKKILVICQRNGCILQRYGSIDDVTVEDFKRAQIKNLNLEELLRRDSVKLNMRVVKEFIEDKTVLVTGGVGSIGSEICRQVLKFGAKKLVIFDIHENGLFDIDVELKKEYDQSRYDLCLGSIRDESRLEEIFSVYKPQIVFHAAAHKHVPMMEINPKEAIKNNVFGTINVGRACIKHGAAKFILISTDKAVNPTSVMGATKRIAELAIGVLNREQKTEFAAVRFGNVLGSNGSVVPFFQKQIEQGGPVTVTHPDMQRYFMTIPEAVQLVLEAGSMANGGEVFVLDMGDPVKIYDLACDLIRLSGLEPQKDIKIVFTGLRPGEKLFEEISLGSEDVTKTSNNKIFICKSDELDASGVKKKVYSLGDRLFSDSEFDAIDEIKQLVPNFTHKS